MNRRHFLLSSVATLTVTFATTSLYAEEWKPVLDPEGLGLLEGAVIVDIRSRKAYAKGHIPGAVNAPYGSWRGPKENPGRVLSSEQLTERLQSIGIESDSTVVVVHQGSNETEFGSAARVYWTLKSAGLTRIAILNGGTQAWVEAGKPIDTETPEILRSKETFQLAGTWMISREGVFDVVTGKRDAILVDARPVAFFEGEKKHGRAVAAGTLEGALNITHDSWFVGSKTEIVTGPQVLEIAEQAGYRPGGPELVSFCNTGHWAATNWFALSELAGIEGVRLYPESLVGWTNAGSALVQGG
ncbi:MAG: rhodanese-like domain-containing protein [Pseudomonadota bacterium]